MLGVLLYSVALFGSMPVKAADSLSLNWKAPEQFTNGERLNAAKDLKEYRVYYGSSIESIKDNVVSVNPAKRSVSLSALDASKLNSSLVYFAMTSVSNDGLESELSPSIFYLP